MTGWWARNAKALLALAIVLPLTGLTVFFNEWKEYYLYSPSFTAPVAEDGTVELAEASWGPARAIDVTGQEDPAAPEGTRVIMVRVPVEVHGEPPACGAPTLVEASTGRTWTEQFYELGFRYVDGESTLCETSATDANGNPVRVEDYELVVPFLVPDDAEGPFWVDVAPLSATPVFARFSVDP